MKKRVPTSVENKKTVERKNYFLAGLYSKKNRKLYKIEILNFLSIVFIKIGLKFDFRNKI